MRALIKVVLRELFEFGVMHTDPNSANFRYQPDSGHLVLLDFGAARSVDAATALAYGRRLRAGLASDREAIRDAAVSAGFLGSAAVARDGARIDGMIDVMIGELDRTDPFDFADRRFVGALREEGMQIASDKASWHVPPVDLLFVQRRISGTSLLAG